MMFGCVYNRIDIIHFAGQGYLKVLLMALEHSDCPDAVRCWREGRAGEKKEMKEPSTGDGSCQRR